MKHRIPLALAALALAFGLGGVPRALAATVTVMTVLEGRTTDGSGHSALLLVGKGLKGVDHLHLEPPTDGDLSLPTVDLPLTTVAGSTLAIFEDSDGLLVPGEYQVTLVLKKGGIQQDAGRVSLAVGGLLPNANVGVDSFSAFADLQDESRIGPGSSQVAPGNHAHLGVYSPIAHTHDTDYPKKADLSAAGTINTVSNPVDWTKIKNVPAAFADGTDDGNSYTAGAGLSLTAGAFAVAYSGTGAAATAARSDHSHDAAYSASNHNHDTLYFTQGQLTSVTGTLNASTNPVDWSQLKSVPAGFADGTDADTTYGAGTGMSLASGNFSVVFAGTGSSTSAARSDHDHDTRYNTQAQLSAATGVLNALTNPLDWSQLKSVPAGFADGSDADTTYAAGPGLVLGSGSFSADFGGPGSAATVARSDHNHDASYAAIVHNHDTRYYTQAQLNSSTGTVNGSTNPLDWSQLKSVPAGFADGVDDSVTFAGTGAAASAARSDHDHDARYFTESELSSLGGTLNDASNPVDWNRLKGVPSSFADGTDETVSLAGTGSATSGARSDHNHDLTYSTQDHLHDVTYAQLVHTHDTRYFTQVQLTSTNGTVNATSNPLDWSQLKSVPTGFADGTDETVTFSGTGSAGTAARADHDHDLDYLGLGGGSLTGGVTVSANTGSAFSGTTFANGAVAVLGAASGVSGTGVKGTVTGGTAVYGVDAATSGGSTGVRGDSSSSSGIGVYGLNTATVGSPSGVLGESGSASGYGVKGSNAAGGTGVYGVSNSGWGVYGTSGQFGRGVFGSNGASNGVGVYGEGSGNGGFGVQGTGTHGVQGTSGTANGNAVWGEHTGTTGAGFGVTGRSFSTTGTGVFAWMGGNGGVALAADHAGTSGNIAEFRSSGSTVATIDKTGKATFNGGVAGLSVSSELSAPGTINTTTNPVDWTKLKGVPSGFADGTDNDTIVVLAGTGSATTGARSDHTHDYLSTSGGTITGASSSYGLSGALKVTDTGTLFAIDAASSSGSGSIRGTSSNAGTGVTGVSTGGNGVSGTDSSTTGTGVGVSGTSSSTGGKGLSGVASASSGTTYGVYGHSGSSTGIGVYGACIVSGSPGYAAGTGVYGVGETGVSGTSPTSNGPGVSGTNTYAWGGTGVYGNGNTYGVNGESLAAAGTGVRGLASGSSGTAVWGEQTSATGSTFGVVGRNASTTGTGVLAYAGGNGGIALVADHLGATGNIAEFRSSGSTVASIDKTGKATFNGGITGVALSTDFSTAGTFNATTNPVDWTKLKGVPTGQGLTVSGSAISVTYAGTGTANSASRSDHDHDVTYLKLAGGTMTGTLNVNGPTGAKAMAVTGSGTSNGEPTLLVDQVSGTGTGPALLAINRGIGPGLAVGTYGGAPSLVVDNNASGQDMVQFKRANSSPVAWVDSVGKAYFKGVEILSSGVLSIPQGSLSLASGNMTLSSGNLTLSSGTLSASTTGTAVSGATSGANGVGVYGYANGSGGTALVAEHDGSAGLIAEFRNGPGVVGSIDLTGLASFAGGVVGSTSSTSGTGVYGNASASTGTTYGVRGNSSSSSGTGVYGVGFTGVAGVATGNFHIGVKGTAPGTSGFGTYGTSSGLDGTGAYGEATGTGTTYGLYGISASTSGTGAYCEAQGVSGTTYGVYGKANSTSGYAGYFTNPGTGVYADSTNATGTTYGVYGRSASSAGYGGYFEATKTSGTTYGAFVKSSSGSGFALYADNAATSGNAYGSYSRSASSGGIGAMGESTSSGTGVFAQSSTGNALVTNIGNGTPSTSANNAAIFQTNLTNVARIDNTGKGFFNGGTQASGADFAESVAVNGPKSEFEPGDVMIIDLSSPRRFAKSASAESNLVAGVYSTKPGYLGTTHDVSGDDTWAGDEIPLAVVGIVPTRVCDEGGPVAIGDMLVTASLPGHAMKAPEHPRAGTVLGKALGSMDGERGVVEVLLGAAR